MKGVFLVQIDYGIGALILLALLVASWAGFWFWVVRRSLPADTLDTVTKGVAYVRAALVGAFSNDDIDKLAGWFFDAFVDGKTTYYTRDEFIALVRNAINSGDRVLAVWPAAAVIGSYEGEEAE
jgi:hypothetical protein